MEILKFLFIVVEVLVLFNLIIIVHELGHYWAARWRGLVVEKFGVWFGKPLWEKEIKGVKYSLGSIPAGGFVALPQMAPMEMLEGDTETERQELPPVSVMDRIIVAAAGPLFSFLLALTFACVIWMVGRPVSEAETTTVIGYVAPDSPALEAGLKPGDRILEIDGYPIEKFGGVGNTVKWRIVSSENDTLAIKYERDGQEIITTASPYKKETKVYQRDSLKQLLIDPMTTPIIADVVENSPAERAGLKVNDVILALNGEKLYHRIPISDHIAEHGAEPLLLTVARGEEVLDISVTPEMPVVNSEEMALASESEEAAAQPEEPRLMIGVVWDISGKWELSHPGPIRQVKASVNTMVKTFGALFSSESDIKAHHLAGPAGIMRMYYHLFKSDHGWRMAIWFSVIFNVNLALLNLLPIPVLDGGHITMALIEGIIRRPIPVKILQWVQSGCAVLLIGFMLYVTFFDVQDFSNPFKLKDRSEEVTISFEDPVEEPAPEPAQP